MKTVNKIPIGIVKAAAVVVIASGFLALAFRGSTAPIEFGNDASRDMAAKSIIADREKTIGQLEDVVKQGVDNPNKKEAAKTAMILLGKLRADDAAPLLALHLSFFVMEDRWKREGLQPPSGRALYPAMDALINIGLPSVDALLWKVANADTDNPKDDDLTVYVLLHVLGKQTAMTVLTETIKGQYEEKQKLKLGVLLTGLQKSPNVPRDVTIQLFP